MSAPGADRGTLLRIRGLETGIGCTGPWILQGVDLELAPGEVLGVVGESGSGKSMLALSLMGLLPQPLAVRAGQAWWGAKDLFSLPPAQRRALRGGEMAMIFQEPMSSLNPVMRVSQQLGEVLRWHRGLHGGAAREQPLRLLRRVQPAARSTRHLSWSRWMRWVSMHSTARTSPHSAVCTKVALWESRRSLHRWGRMAARLKMWWSRSCCRLDSSRERGKGGASPPLAPSMCISRSTQARTSGRACSPSERGFVQVNAGAAATAPRAPAPMNRLAQAILDRSRVHRRPRPGSECWR